MSTSGTAKKDKKNKNKKNKTPTRGKGIAQLEKQRLEEEQRKAGADKNKKNKTPTRGMGIAQLEKQRLEEEQRKAGAAAAPPPAMSNPSAQSNSTWTFAPFPRAARKTSLHPTLAPRPFVYFMGPPPLRQDSVAVAVGSSGSGFLPVPRGAFMGPPPLRQDSVAVAVGSSSSGFLPVPRGALMGPPPLRQDSVAVAAGSSGSGFSTIPRGASVSGYQEEDEMVRGWRAAAQMRQQQQHQHESLVALAKKACTTLSSSGNNVQIEPPSNQNVTNNYDMHTSWGQGKMAGAKRDCPFQQDSSVCQSASNPRKVSALTGSHRKFEESLPSHGNSAVLSETQSAVFGGSNSGSSVFNRSSEVQVDRKGKQDVATADGAFLTLGPTAQPLLNTTLSSGDNSDHSSVLCQESLKSSSTSHGRPFYNFLPPTDKDHEATSPDTSPEKKEAKKDVDLNLKL